jgi:uroporphyrinogen III methyltransferase/synthase
VVFTSANGVAALAETLRERHQDLRLLGRAKIAAIGPETARAAERHGLWVDFVPPRYVAEAIADAFPEPVSGKRILIPRAKEAREVLPELWRESGATVDVVPVYETLPDLDGIDRLRRRIAEGTVDFVTFTASSTVINLLKEVPAEMLRGLTLAAIGPITAATLREAGLAPQIEAEEHTVEGLVAALKTDTQPKSA